ncbi:MAG: glycosyltransferase [Flammeovirgaceae bacterium]|nr:glycosyltransferase [Flammeovirgaceae bacterium]
MRGSKKFDQNIRGRFYWLRMKVMIPMLYRKADEIVTVNKGIARELRNYFGVKSVGIRCIPNFYNIREIEALSKEEKSDREKMLYADPILIITGRLALEKGIEGLLNVFNELKRSRLNLRMVIVGEGPEQLTIERFCKNQNLKFQNGFDFHRLPDIVLVNFQTNVYKYLKGSTLFLMNSASEGFPNGLVEAMICGVPVLSSDCPYGPREIFEADTSENFQYPVYTETGVLLPNADSDKNIQLWKTVIEKLLVNQSQRETMISAARLSMKKYDQEIISKQWLSLVEA